MLPTHRRILWQHGLRLQTFSRILHPIKLHVLYLSRRSPSNHKTNFYSYESEFHVVIRNSEFLFFFPLEQYYLLDMKLIAPLNIQISFICALMSCVETNIPMISHICITCRLPPVAVPKHLTHGDRSTQRRPRQQTELLINSECVRL
jgi:hypothetical protein